MPSKFGGVPVNESQFGGVPIAYDQQASFEQLSTPEAVEPRKPVTPIQRMAQGAIGGEEVLASMMTGSLREAISGGAGLVDLVSNLVSGESDPLGGAAETIESVRERIPVYSPQTETGQNFLEGISKPLQRFSEFAKEKGTSVLSETGSPALATVEQMTIEAAPGLLGLRNPLSRKSPDALGSIRQRSSDVSEATSQMEGAGINPRSSIAEQGAQVVRGVQDLASQTSRGGDLSSIQRAVISAYNQSRKNVSEMFDAAKSGNATFPTSAAKEFAKNAIDSVSDFDIQDMPRLRARVDELKAMEDLPDNSALKLNALANFRKKINRKAPVNDVEQNVALGILKGQVDSFMQDLFDADMISGDRLAITRWRSANQAYRQHAQTFKADKTINNMIKQEATPEQMSNWIFGASSVGAKSQSGQVVKRLKDILGEDSQQFNALRQEVVYDVMKPLLVEKPNFRQFVNRYNQFVSRNPTLAKELFPDSYDDLRILKRQSEALLKSGGEKINFDLNTAASRALFGHGIAKAGLRVQLARQGISILRRMAEGSDQRRIMSDIVGYDIGAPLIPISAPILTGAAPQQEEQWPID